MIYNSKKTVMVFGTFDILHEGHMNFFKQAREYGDRLIIVVGRDKTVKEVKGSYPTHNEKNRLKELIDKNVADKVLLGTCGDDKYEIIKKIKPDCIGLGYDQKFFIDKLYNEFPNIQIVRLRAYMPKIYKSSLLRNHLK